MDMAWLPLVCTVRLGTPVYRRTLVSPFFVSCHVAMLRRKCLLSAMRIAPPPNLPNVRSLPR